MRYTPWIVTALLLAHTGMAADSDPFGWENLPRTAKPWARWWWLGSAVTEAELTRQLQRLRDAGFGGVEVQPIYAAKDAPTEPIPFLSERWAEVFKHTLREGERLDLGVDWTLGSGWPFGGPWLKPEHAARKMIIEQRIVDSADPSRTIRDNPKEPVQAVILNDPARPAAPGKVIEPLEIDGNMTWIIPDGDWLVCEVRAGYTGQQVKRASPGSEGPAVDHFSREAFDDYRVPFERVLAWLGDARPRATFNDSYEVFGADWTLDFLTEFQARRGYDLRPYIPCIIGDSEDDLARRVLHDYRETVEELFREDFLLEWRAWSHKNGMKTRFQAHGSPGHLVDLYGLSDIPETEGFGRIGIEILPAKMASSAAHLFGRPLCSSETFTWIGEHFQVSLDPMRKSVDDFFLSGVNHVFYHGVPYSPENVPFPGWLFYASTNSGEHTTWFPHIKHFNAYMARIQSVMQAGRFDGDVLLYYPIHDLFRFTEGSHGHLQYCRIHNTDNWMRKAATSTQEAAEALWSHGVQFDYVSDRVIYERLAVKNGRIHSGDASYSALIVPECDWMDARALESIAELAASGAKVFFVSAIPHPVPRNGDPTSDDMGFSNVLHTRFTELIDTGQQVSELPSIEELPAVLYRAGIRKETLPGSGFDFVRRTDGFQTLYFLKHRGGKPYEGWVRLSAQGPQVVLGDPLTGAVYAPRQRLTAKGVEVLVSMEAGHTCVVAVGPGLGVVDPSAIPRKLGERIEIAGPWELSWTGHDGKAYTYDLARLQDWTAVPQLTRFSGTVAYETVFDVDQDTSAWLLDLGQLHESADVYVDREYAGTVWCEPYRLAIDRTLNRGAHTLRLEVTNLTANRMIELDRKEVPWKKFFFVDIDYEEFNASKWKPLPSGVLGPVHLTPYK